MPMRSHADDTERPPESEAQNHTRSMRRRWRWPRRAWQARPRRAGTGHHLRHRRRWAVTGLALLLISTIVLSQGNGAFGAWSADVLRTVLGPQRTAQVEAWYLGVQDAAHQAEYRISGAHAAAPWSVAHTPVPSPRTTSPSAPQAMPLSPIAPMVQPALPGEGVWTSDGMPPPATGQPPIVAKTFLRPDPARPYAVATLLQFDMRYARLHLVAGTTEPGGPLHMYGPGAISTADQQGNTLLAAFNGGFKYADGQYGMMVNGTVYVQPQYGAATIAVTKQGNVLLGAWGTDAALNSSNANLVAWRQNAALLLDQGVLNPLTNDGAAWGGTVLNSTYTWRSGLGITANGTLLYAAGNSLSAATLGQTLRAAGAVMAMQTDINPFWVRAFLYQRGADGNLQITKLHPQMHGSGLEYLRGMQRDFFYLTRTLWLPPCAGATSAHASAIPCMHG